MAHARSALSFGAPPQSLKKITFRALGWAGVGSALSVAITFTRLAILSRLLTPADFGIFAVGNSLVTFLAGLAQGLFAAALLQDRVGTRDNSSAASGLACSVLFGLLCASVLLLFPGQLGAAYRIESYSAVFMYMAPVVVLRCMAQVPWAVLQRELRFRTEFACTGAALLTGTIVSVAMAWHGEGFRALVAGLVAEAAVLALATLSASWRSIAARPTAQAALGLVLRFGGSYSVTFVSGIMNQGVQYFLVSMRESAFSLGLFSRAQALHEAFSGSVFGAFINRLFRIFPLMNGDTQRLGKAMAVSIELVALITLPVTAMLFFSADTIVRILLGPDWSQAAVLFAIFSLGLMPRLCYKVTEFISYALGRAFSTSIRSVANLAAVAAAILLAAPFGLTWIVAAVAGVAALNYLTSAAIAVKGLGWTWTAFSVLHLRGMVLATVIVVVFLLQPNHSVLPGVLADIVSCAIGTLLVLACCWAFPTVLLGERILDLSPKLRRWVRC